MFAQLQAQWFAQWGLYTLILVAYVLLFTQEFFQDFVWIKHFKIPGIFFQKNKNKSPGLKFGFKDCRVGKQSACVDDIIQECAEERGIRDSVQSAGLNVSTRECV